jgi:hypothetical protein
LRTWPKIVEFTSAIGIEVEMAVGRWSELFLVIETIVADAERYER